MRMIGLLFEDLGTAVIKKNSLHSFLIKTDLALAPSKNLIESNNCLQCSHLLVILSQFSSFQILLNFKTIPKTIYLFFIFAFSKPHYKHHNY